MQFSLDAGQRLFGSSAGSCAFDEEVQAAVLDGLSAPKTLVGFCESSEVGVPTRGRHNTQDSACAYPC
jgi:hypothetical protein